MTFPSCCYLNKHCPPCCCNLIILYLGSLTSSHCIGIICFPALPVHPPTWYLGVPTKCKKGGREKGKVERQRVEWMEDRQRMWKESVLGWSQGLCINLSAAVASQPLHSLFPVCLASQALGSRCLVFPHRLQWVEQCPPQQYSQVLTPGMCEYNL